MTVFLAELDCSSFETHQGWRFAPPRFERLRPCPVTLDVQWAYQAADTAHRPLRRSFHNTLSRAMALSVVRIFRITATMTTFDFFPVACRRSWKTLSAGLQRLAIRAAM